MNRPPSRRVAISCAALVLLSLGASLVFLAAYPLPEVKNDAVEYLALARNVAAGAGFSYDGASPAVYRPPLFSLLLGGWFAATGTSSVLSAAVFQTLVHALGVLAAFLLFLEVAPRRAWAFGGALFLAVNPLLVTRVVFVLQEPTLLLFTTLGALLSVRLVKEPSAARAGLAGAAWGLATLAKVVAWFAPFLLLAMRFFPGRLGWSLRGKEVAALLVCFAAAVAPWTLRNQLHFGRFIPVNDQGYGLLEWNVKHADPPGAVPGNRFVGELRERGLDPEARRAALWGYVLEHPRYFLVDGVVRKAFHFTGPARDWWWERGRYGPGEKRPWYWTVHDYLYRGLFLLIPIGLGMWSRKGPGAHTGFLAAFGLLYWAEHALTWGTPRYGLAMLPVALAVLLALGMDRLRGNEAPHFAEDGISRTTPLAEDGGRPEGGV
ncbi:MAG: hypothetical protein A2X88_09715 [Deltaproteobacteria bacterium GWC2_65_14]|nr:MAG: hypothetical protein A2X88_09715 [Deltaproteobacteria bacterium GWC2_65_14]